MTRLALTDFPCENTQFYLAPIYKHQSDRDNFVFFGEEFYILSNLKHQNESLYLNASSNSLEKQILEELDAGEVKKKKQDKVVLS